MTRPKPYSIQRRSLPGAPPGTLISPTEARQPVIDVMAYTKAGHTEIADASVDAIRALRAQHDVTWVNVSGLGDTALMLQIAELFALHDLALEDVLNVHQRPKVEEYEDHLFIVVRTSACADGADTEQVSLFLGKDYVLSVQENGGDCFGPVRERIRKGKSLIRERGPDHLCYALIDAAVDSFFPVLERLGEDLEYLEDAVVDKAETGTIESLHDMKRKFLSLRRAIWPHREALSRLAREEHYLLSHDTQVYLRDCYDHTIQLMDIVETYREIASGLVDVYISSVSAKLNDIMKVLTIIATVFMPLGFIASVYGMNFDPAVSPWNMPELGWRLGYPFALGLMAACAGGMMVYFWRKGWLTEYRRSRRAGRD